RSLLALGILGLVEFAPSALLVLVTGPVADRHDRRRVVAVASVGEAAAAAALLWYTTTKPTSATPIFFIAFTFRIARAFGARAGRALPADIVPAARLPWLVARFSATWQAAIIVGPVLGGFLYAIDPGLTYLAVVLLLLGAAGLILGVRIQA